MQIKKVKNSKNSIFEKRCSIRRYKKDVEISKEELENIINDAMSAPSSLNLQPWRFVVIHSHEAKKAVKDFMLYNQTQYETCSAMIVIYADILHVKKANELLSGDVVLGLRDENSKNKTLGFIENVISSRDKEQIIRSHFLDCGFVSMQLMLSAVNYGYDTNPIGAFDREGISKYLKIDTSRYIPIVLFTIGKADESGKITSRFDVNEITTWF